VPRAPNVDAVQPLLAIPRGCAVSDDTFDARQQVCRQATLVHTAVGTRLDRTGVIAKPDRAGSRSKSSRPASSWRTARADFQTIHSWHANVEQNDIGTKFASLADCVRFHFPRRRILPNFSLDARISITPRRTRSLSSTTRIRIEIACAPETLTQRIRVGLLGYVSERFSLKNWKSESDSCALVVGRNVHVPAKLPHPFAHSSDSHSGALGLNVSQPFRRYAFSLVLHFEKDVFASARYANDCALAAACGDECSSGTPAPGGT